MDDKLTSEIFLAVIIRRGFIQQLIYVNANVLSFRGFHRVKYNDMTEYYKYVQPGDVVITCFTYSASWSYTPKFSKWTGHGVFGFDLL